MNNRYKLLLVIKFIIFLLIISIIYYIHKLYKFKLIKKEKFKNDIIFMDVNNVISFLYSDPDNYTKKLTKYDMIARKVYNLNEYLDKITKCIINFDENQKKTIREACIEADNYLKNYNELLNGTKIAEIPWKFALSNYNNNFEYEDGLPHTREDIIFLSEKIIPNKNNENFVNTLIHEKIHIYQRYNYLIIEKIINKLGYFNSDYKKNIRSRSNPDLNENIYINNNNEILECVYKNNNPININDVDCFKNKTYMEHPYELLAYEIANKYKMNQIEKFKELI